MEGSGCEEEAISFCNVFPRAEPQGMNPKEGEMSTTLEHQILEYLKSFENENESAFSTSTSITVPNVHGLQY